MYCTFDACFCRSLWIYIVFGNPLTESSHTAWWLRLDLYRLEDFFRISSTTFHTFGTTCCRSRHIFCTPFTFSSDATTFHTFHSHRTDKFFLICCFLYCSYFFSNGLFF